MTRPPNKSKSPPPRASGPVEVSLYEDDIYGEKEAPEPTRGLVVFSLGDEWYGVDVMQVQEVAPV